MSCAAPTELGPSSCARCCKHFAPYGAKLPRSTALAEDYGRMPVSRARRLSRFERAERGACQYVGKGQLRIEIRTLIFDQAV